MNPGSVLLSMYLAILFLTGILALLYYYVDGPKLNSTDLSLTIDTYK